MMLLNQLDPDKKKEFEDWQESLRKFLGAGKENEDRNWFADLLYKGAPYALLGADTSKRLGMGDMLSLAPYTDVSEAANDRDTYYKAMGQVLGGALGGLGAKAVDAFGYLREDDMPRAAEAMAPGVVGSAMKAKRLATQGVTARNGDVLVKPEDISGMDAFYTALGVQPRDLANQADRRSLAYQADEFYSQQVTTLKRRFLNAQRDGDASKAEKVREDWVELQAARQRQGFRPQPLSALLRSQGQQLRREQRVVGGVPATRSNLGYLQSLTDQEP
jgi:hypothetical protein